MSRPESPRPRRGGPKTAHDRGRRRNRRAAVRKHDLGSRQPIEVRPYLRPRDPSPPPSVRPADPTEGHGRQEGSSLADQRGVKSPAVRAEGGDATETRRVQGRDVDHDSSLEVVLRNGAPAARRRCSPNRTASLSVSADRLRSRTARRPAGARRGNVRQKACELHRSRATRGGICRPRSPSAARPNQDRPSC